jgi:hypothetical protein
MARSHAADLDAIHLLAALVEDRQRELLKSPAPMAMASPSPRMGKLTR